MQALGNWVLSWYADDVVGQADASILNRFYNLPLNYQQRSRSHPLTTVRLAESGARADLRLGEPDARFLVTTLTAPGRVALFSSVAPDTTALTMGVLRIR